MSPSFTGRPFIEGNTESQRVAAPSSRRPLRDGLSLRVSLARSSCQRAVGRRPLRDGLSLRGRHGPVQHQRLHRRRPLRDGLSLRVAPTRPRRLRMGQSPSFTGRPFIEGASDCSPSWSHAGSPSFTGRPFIEGVRAARGSSWLTLGRRPLRDGLSLRVECGAQHHRLRAVAVLYGTVFH